ncbi:hypothetical protein ISCGN_005484 [Ixodes scapularis]
MLNPDVNAFQRKFVNEIRRCDEMERKLRFVEGEIKNDQLPLPEDGDEVGNLPQARDMVDLEANVDRLECELREINENNRLLQKNYVELTEIKLLLRTIDDFFDQPHTTNAEEEENDMRMLQDPPSTTGVDEHDMAPRIKVTSRAIRRKTRASLATQTLNLSPPQPALRPSRPVLKPKPPPLPADDFKLTIRPRNGLVLSKRRTPHSEQGLPWALSAARQPAKRTDVDRQAEIENPFWPARGPLIKIFRCPVPIS